MIVSSSWKYEGLTASGNGILCISDMNDWKNRSCLTDPCGVTFEMEEGITEVEEGFFDLIPNLIRINFPNSLKKLGMKDSTAELFRRNNVIISGCFDSYAESFAQEYGLSFLHSDIELARAGSYDEPGGSDIITLRFMTDGRTLILQSNFCQGSSAGNNGGGDEVIGLNADFYKTMSAEDIANMCWGNCFSEIKSNTELASFLKKAVQKGGYCLTFRNRN